MDTWLSEIRDRLFGLSIFRRIVLGNAVVILIGAVCGTLLTRWLAEAATSLWLIILFAVVGTALSVGMNAWFIGRCMQPLHDLNRLTARIAAGQAQFHGRKPTNINLDAEPIDINRFDIERLASTLDSLVHQLADRNQKLSALSERIIKAQEEERIRIARCLHDDTGQSLSTLIITLERLENRLPDRQVDLQQRLASARKLAASTLVELRKIIFDLRPTILDDLGLVPAIRWYARSYLEAQGIKVRLFMPEETFHLPGEISSTMFRIYQEAINNVVRHASASLVLISLCQEGDEVSLQIQDDGVGFDLSSLHDQGPSLEKLGLLGIQERVDLVGGGVIVDSAPGKGTRLLVSVPYSGSGGELGG